MRTAVTVLAVLALAHPLAAQQPAQPAPPTWDIMLGGGATFAPSYLGAEEYQFFPVPMTQVSWRGRLYLGPSAAGNGAAIGANLIRTGGLRVAAEAGVLPDRPADRADALVGMDDRDFVATASGIVSYTLGAFELSASGTRGLNDGAGFVGTAMLSYTQPVGERLITTIGVGASFADARQMRWDFGVTRHEAARRQSLIDAGDDRLESDDGNAFRPGAGLRQFGASLSMVYLMTSHWAVIGFGGVDRLSSEAAESPLVRRREQLSGGLGIAYRF